MPAIPKLVALIAGILRILALLVVSNRWRGVDGDVLPAIDAGIVQDNIGGAGANS